jgi:hypothetical protein
MLANPLCRRIVEFRSVPTGRRYSGRAFPGLRCASPWAIFMFSLRETGATLGKHGRRQGDRGRRWGNMVGARETWSTLGRRARSCSRANCQCFISPRMGEASEGLLQSLRAGALHENLLRSKFWGLCGTAAHGAFGSAGGYLLPRLQAGNFAGQGIDVGKQLRVVLVVG